MMTVYCDELEKRVILNVGDVLGINGHDGRLTVAYTCVCGQRGRLHTGRDRISGGMSGHIHV